MQLCEMLEVLWWRLPLDYKMSLHATFAAAAAGPSCYAVQVAIRQHGSQLRTSIAYHFHHAPRSTLRPADAYAVLDQQWSQLNAVQKAVLMGFLVDDPLLVAAECGSLPHFSAYRCIFCDYLHLLTAAAAAAKNMARN